MKHRLFNLLAGLSLVLCLATIAMCIRSCDHFDSIWYGSPQSRGGILTVIFTSRLTVTFDRAAVDWRVKGRGWRLKVGDQLVPDEFSPSPTWKTNSYRDLQHFHFAMWVIPVVCSILPLLWLIYVLRARKRTLPGACLTCGYDLRATPNRCPECGMVPNKTA